MKKEIAMSNNLLTMTEWNFRKLKNVLAEKLQYKRRLRSFTIFYSRVAGQPLTTGEALRILHVQIACMFLLLPCEISLFVRVLFLIWTCLALYSCRTIK